MLAQSDPKRRKFWILLFYYIKFIFLCDTSLHRHTFKLFGETSSFGDIFYCLTVQSDNDSSSILYSNSIVYVVSTSTWPVGGVNVINILCARFSYKSKLSTFSLITFSIVIFWCQNISAKLACKMLMKLTSSRIADP